MFRGQALIKPKTKSIIFALIVAFIVFWGSQASALFGYAAGLVGLLVIIVASFMDSFWPTRGKSENPVVFSLFWGIIVGGVFPFLLHTLLDDGLKGVYEVFTSQP